MRWGALLQGAGAAVGYEGQSRDRKKQARSDARYRKAWDHLSAMDRDDETALGVHLANLTRDRAAGYDELARALGSEDRQRAGASGRGEWMGRLDHAMRPVVAATQVDQREGISGVAGNAGGNWANLAWADHEPRLSSTAAMIGEEGAQEGYRDFDWGAHQRHREGNIDIDRRTGERKRRAAQMRSFRERLLGEEASRFKYRGPSNSFYNSQMLAQGLALAGQGIDAYGSSGSSGKTQYEV